MTNKQDREGEGLLAHLTLVISKAMHKGGPEYIARSVIAAWNTRTQPPASEGLVTDAMADLEKLEAWLADGSFYSNYDESSRLLGVFRRHLAALQAGVEGLVEKFAMTRLGDTSGRLIEDVLDRSEIRAALSTGVIRGGE